MDEETLFVVKVIMLGFSAGLVFGWWLCGLNFSDSSSPSNPNSSDRQDKESKS